MDVSKLTERHIGNVAPSPGYRAELFTYARRNYVNTTARNLGIDLDA